MKYISCVAKVSDPFSLAELTLCLLSPWYVCECVLVTQTCSTLRDPMDCSPPGSSVHGILQARMKMSDTCRLFPPFGDPWPSCLLLPHFYRLQSPGPGLQRLWKVCPFFLLENSRPLSPWGPIDFLSTCLGNDSLINVNGIKNNYIFQNKNYSGTVAISLISDFIEWYSNLRSASLFSCDMLIWLKWVNKI